MTEETLRQYGPCTKHELWHDLEQSCFYCVVETAGKGPAAPDSYRRIDDDGEGDRQRFSR